MLHKVANYWPAIYQEPKRLEVPLRLIVQASTAVGPSDSGKNRQTPLMDNFESMQYQTNDDDDDIPTNEEGLKNKVD